MSELTIARVVSEIEVDQPEQSEIERLRVEVERLRAIVDRHAQGMAPHEDGTRLWIMDGTVGRGRTVYEAAEAAKAGGVS